MARWISVVLPVYNGRTYLRQAIESVLMQTHAPLELIAIDDGSTDDSAAILDEYGDRIVVIRQENSGVAAARNAGIERARGEFVAFLDQDDWWLPEKLARQTSMFARSERIGLVHTAVKYFNETLGREVGPQDPLARPETMAGDCYERLLLGNPLVNSSAMVRRSALDRVGLCDLQISGNTVQDYDLWLRIAREYEFAYVAEPLTTFRLHGDQGHRDRRAMLGEELRLMLRHRPDSDWCATATGCRRMADLRDSLATAHFEASEPALARRYFAQAARTEPSLRRWTRLAASYLPFALMRRLRLAWHKLKFRQAAVSSGALPPALVDSAAKC